MAANESAGELGGGKHREDWRWTEADFALVAWPLADQALAQDLLDLIQSASHYRQLKKGREL